MRRRRTLVICAVCALLAILALLAYNLPPREPSYDGHPLSFWVISLGTEPVGLFHDGARIKQAQTAVDHIGAAALPFLLKWIQYEPPAWRRTLGHYLFTTPIPFAHQLSDWITEPSGYQLFLGARVAFDVLGKRAMPVRDDLCRLMNNTNSPYTANEAAAALGSIGTNALPALLMVATNAQHPTRLAAINAIGKISDLGDAAQQVVPAITNCLNGTNNPTLQLIAISTLGSLKASPQVSVPALVSCLKSPNARLRGYSALAIGEFGPQALSAIPALTNALVDSDSNVRAWAAEALHQIDPTTFTNAYGQSILGTKIVVQ